MHEEQRLGKADNVVAAQVPLPVFVKQSKQQIGIARGVSENYLSQTSYDVLQAQDLRVFGLRKTFVIPGSDALEDFASTYDAIEVPEKVRHDLLPCDLKPGIVDATRASFYPIGLQV